VNRKTIETFLLTVESEYRPNAYHNNIHGSDVTQTAAIIMESYVKHWSALSKFDVFAIIVAAAVHDLGHLGVNNDFLINSRHPRATTFNDRSVNESYHISRAFEIARTCRGCDIFELFTFDEHKKVRCQQPETAFVGVRDEKEREACCFCLLYGVHGEGVASTRAMCGGVATHVAMRCTLCCHAHRADAQADGRHGDGDGHGHSL
jgi:hypothetical protein